MTTAHTPGPWRQGNGYYWGEGYAICGDHGIVAGVVGKGYPCGLGRHPESDANARLIAAAPELLAALERFAALPCTMPQGGHCSMVHPGAFCAPCHARAAVARARGES
jgi:hypothetical protein